ncbi:MAG: hypothetical protein HQ594_05065 [Candidatus Omnitrophica bacterium]|nr:hypothetical protein [Candidatus Omnitrophota bacterium]
MNKTRSIGRSFLGLVVFFYGIMLAYISSKGIPLFYSGFFEDKFNLILVVILLPLALGYIFSGTDILMMKERGRKTLFVVSPVTLILFTAAVIYSLITGTGVSVDASTISIMVLPIIFVFFVTRLK